MTQTNSQNPYSAYFLITGFSFVIKNVWMLSKLPPEAFQVVLACMFLINLSFRLPQGNNGTFRMFLEGDGGMFEVTPPEGVNFASFLIRVRNPTLLDFEKVKGMLIGPRAGQDRRWWRDGESISSFPFPVPMPVHREWKETMWRALSMLLFLLWFDIIVKLKSRWKGKDYH